jgi:Histidinol-phosphate/aromatic aminotransferase and cobyric acid decarboxylase
MSRDVVAAMTAYTLELREAEIKLNQNESPSDFPRELKEGVLAHILERSWNIYPDFESMMLRGALAKAYSYEAANVLVGNGSNELLAATIPTFVGPGTPVILPKPTFALYEKLVAVAGGIALPIAVDPSTGFLPLDEMLRGIARCDDAVVIVCSPNNPTGGVLPDGGIEALLATGATVLFDRAYGDFAEDAMPPLHDRLVTFSTFSKAWGLAGLRVGWLASTASTCREIRKVKLPYSLNIISEAVAATALDHGEIRARNVAATIAERERMFAAMQQLAGVTPFPSRANFIAFATRRDAKEVFNALHARGILVRDISAAVPNSLRVSVGNATQNDAFLAALDQSMRDAS